MGKVSEKQKSKRANILDSAYELFIEKSFNNTTIDDVVKKAGIAKGTFYLYFKDKYDLMDRIIIRKGASMLLYVLKVLNEKKKTQSMNFSEQMLFITEEIVDYLEKNKEALALLGKKITSCLDYFNTIEDSELKKLTDELVSENEANGFTCEETKKRIYLIISLVGSVCYDSLVYESPFKLSEVKPVLFSSVNSILQSS